MKELNIDRLRDRSSGPRPLTDDEIIADSHEINARAGGAAAFNERSARQQAFLDRFRSAIPDLQKEHPNQWAARSEDGGVAVGDSRPEVLRKVRSRSHAHASVRTAFLGDFLMAPTPWPAIIRRTNYRKQEATAMAAYIIATIEVTDPEQFEVYRGQVPATIAKHGGKYLARGGAVEVVEGDQPARRTVVLEFDSLEKARGWYYSDDYAGPKELRIASTRSNVMIVDGV